MHWIVLSERYSQRIPISLSVSMILFLSTVVISLVHAGFQEANPTVQPDYQGARIYQKNCAKCHGAGGQGTKEEYDEPLYGDRSIKSLARLIERTMPENDPESIVGNEARQVAEFIYHEFYSLKARENKLPPPRIGLTRLTVAQYQNAIADLIGCFSIPQTDTASEQKTSEGEPEAVPGLRAEYFQSKGMNKADKLQIRRIDHVIDFNFGEGSPAEEITPDQFAAIWEGALIANDTGHYEFRIWTQNGARLYLNTENTGKRRKMRDDSSLAGQAALIDGWVSSGKMRELTGRMFLIGGRQYPIRLEFFKYKEKDASIRFEWKTPHNPWALLDKRHLTTAQSPRTFVVKAAFPADDHSLGYERGSSVSPGWHAATTQGALATTAEVIARLPILARFNSDVSDHKVLLQDFVARFASIAFRRPLTDEERHLYREILFQGVDSPEVAVRRAVLLTLKSPHFLYPNQPAPNQNLSQHTVAARLALALWDSIPDRALRTAANQGQLETPEQIEAHVRIMLRDPRARAKVRRFFHHWLEIEERDLTKDETLFPQFDAGIAADLRYSLELFVDQVVWSETSDYRQLLLSNSLLLNNRLASLYVTSEADHKSDDTPTSQRSVSDFQPVSFPPQERAGILTHPFLLSAFAYHNTTSPIHRGVFLTRNIMGRHLKPPPEAVAFKNEAFPQDLTMREKITELTRDTACMTCHSIINPLGFALENFDAVGRWRITDNNHPVDSKSKYVTLDGDTLEVENARDLALVAAASPSAHQAFVVKLFQHLINQAPAAYGRNTTEHLRLHFEREDYNIQKLIARIAVVAAIHDRTQTQHYEQNRLPPPTISP
ncbi:MAG: Anti-sigma-I factor RsgI3 [Verrucomicrobia subdivision 3 bacterium]|nr:Anti-sigma-I factor RsgI3 [Limisphaerales bacterium]MCS1413125.1 Anti-sigma-I factor RsgI3 [Limisphaerales bacterium]